MTTIISDDEREKQVLDLYYNQKKNTRDIAKIMRISFTKITNILKKDREQKEREGQKKKLDYHNNNYNNIDNSNSSYYDGGNNGNGKAEPQQHQIIPLSLSQTQLEELNDKQKA